MSDKENFTDFSIKTAHYLSLIITNKAGELIDHD